MRKGQRQTGIEVVSEKLGCIDGDVVVKNYIGLADSIELRVSVGSFLNGFSATYQFNRAGAEELIAKLQAAVRQSREGDPCGR